MLRMLVLAAALLAAFPLGAQSPDPIKQRAAEIQKWRTIFADEDPTVRLSALEAVVNGKDPSLRALAIDAALKTSDTGLLSAALLRIFAGMRTIIIEPTSKGLILTLTISKFDPATGSFQASGVFRNQNAGGASQCGSNQPTIQGQLAGLTVQFADNVCMGRLQYKEKRFVGTIGLGGQQPYEGTFPVQ
jgi:hypothetical protein